jgi:hypothetical protein
MFWFCKLARPKNQLLENNNNNNKSIFCKSTKWFLFSLKKRLLENDDDDDDKFFNSSFTSSRTKRNRDLGLSNVLLNYVPLKHYLLNQLSIGIVKTICKMENT